MEWVARTRTAVFPKTALTVKVTLVVVLSGLDATEVAGDLDSGVQGR